MLTSHFRELGHTAVLGAILLAALAAPAWAQKGGGGGGGGGGGASSGGGGGGSTKVTTTIVTVPLFGTYYGVGGSGSTVATGSATLTYDVTQTLRSMTLAVSNVQLADGVIMHCVITDNGLTQPTTYYPINAPQLVGDLSLSAGQASVSGSTANGNNVLLFGTIGSITVVAINPVTGQNLGLVVSGSFNLISPKGGGGNGGNP
jgi:hypothetical protein